MITAKSFACGYEQTVIGDADFAIAGGKITALIGANGSGKSTLALALSGLKDFKGEVQIDELCLTRRTPMKAIRHKVGLVFQNPDHQILFSRVQDDLEFILNNLDWPKLERSLAINQALATVGLSDYGNVNPRNLSGGQKQRLALASALLTKPNYLILDEATSMLDVEGRQAIYQILVNLAKEGIGVLMITNSLDELLWADEVLILCNGRIKKFTQREIIEHPELLAEAGLRAPFILRLAQKQRVYSWRELEQSLKIGS